MRRLLPYEHQLIESLGITEDEYFEFVKVYKEYRDPKVGTALDIRATGTEVAIVLTVVGILFQVGAALLAPKPEIPDISDRRRRNREQRFAPTFGFNSTQELASYGDPVNLVYTNQNGKGDVRVAGSLVWSAIDNFGSAQFMRLVLALGASEIKQIDYTKTAFGQLAFTDLDRESIYVFEGVNKPPTLNDYVDGFAGKTRYPRLLKPTTDNQHPAFMPLYSGFTTNVGHRLGYSQAYTPSSYTSLGVYDAIPINVDVLSRDKKGKTESANIGIELRGSGSRGNQYDNNVWRSANGASKSFAKGDKIVIFFNNIGPDGGARQPRKAGEDLRRQFAETLDFGSTYMLGAAKFRLDGYESDSRLVTADDEVRARFVCIKEGQVPKSDYRTKRPIKYDEDKLDELEREFQEGLDILNGSEDEDRTVKLPEADIDFTGTVKAAWIPKFKSEVSLDYNSKNGQENVNLATGLGEVTVYFEKRGSIAYTNDLKGQVSAGQVDDDEEQDLVIKTKKLRKKARRQKRALKQLVEDIRAGIFDGGELEETIPDITFQYIHSLATYNNLRNRGSSVNVPPGSAFEGHLREASCFGVSQSDFNNAYRSFVTDTSHKDVETGISHQPYAFTFRYKASTGVLHFFNFTGIQDGTTETVFTNDSKLEKRQRKLRNAIEKTQKAKNEYTNFLKSNTKIKSSSISDDSPSDTKFILNKFTDTTNPVYNNYQDASKTEEERREKVAERIEKLKSERRAEAIAIIENDISLIDQFLDELPADEQIPDRVGKKTCRKVLKALKKSKEEAKTTLDDYLTNWPDLFVETLDNNFFVKCLVKIEEAAYTTLNECNAVTFSLKSRLFRRISGRQKKYADRKVEEYSNSDNGVKSRIAFFRVFYREAGSTFQNEVPHIFAIRHGSDADFYTQFTFFSERSSKWEFKFEPAYDMHAELRNNSFYNYFFLENTDTNVTQSITLNEKFKIIFQGRVVEHSVARDYYPNEDESGPYLTNEWDMFSVNSDTQVQFSFESGPEIALTAVTEQQLDDDYQNKYKNMQMMSLGIFAGRGIQDLRSVSTLVTEGKACRTVESIGTNKAPTASSSYAPDIFVDTLLDKENGIGKYITDEHLDKDSLVLAKNFCKHNNLPGTVGLYMDCLIADVGSWREFWINAAPFSLLELARKNGKDTLVPALPTDGNGKAALNDGTPVELTISALFTTGNILEDSYKEEYLNYSTATEDIIASVIYRQYDEKEIFSVKESVEVRLKEDLSPTAIRETFDLSQFVSRREQAIMFGKLICNQRRYIRKGIEFQTYPSEAIIEPGSFIYIDIGQAHWDSYSTGIIMEGGQLNTPLQDAPANGTYQFLVYKTGTDEADTVTATVTGGVASSLSDKAGYMFVLGTEKPSKQVYRVTEVSIEEEGEVSVKALEYPCFESGGKLRARIADFRSSKFDVS